MRTICTISMCTLCSSIDRHPAGLGLQRLGPLCSIGCYCDRLTALGVIRLCSLSRDGDVNLGCLVGHRTLRRMRRLHWPHGDLPWRGILRRRCLGLQSGSGSILETLDLVLHNLDGDLQCVDFVCLMGHDGHLLCHELECTILSGHGMSRHRDTSTSLQLPGDMDFACEAFEQLADAQHLTL